ncbi:hypothetical protein [Tsukamurella ocularis]|uniref:hypothetical protein n=1 Tax=Tsukamurella ocularis TaxID=1970234 RepID=UPI002167C9B5|nr:hypothetical protein [Tsukamurella ocularis]MCS3781831.1 hypothetical protein [Tsukamurella ocularis]MCS3788325.1 hypothetical protein [Tsukamurella ocularis]MCS3852045.1 hypothetical protein [Tsukamurella ocularis]
MSVRKLVASAAATAIACVAVPGAAQAEPNAVSCSPSPSVGAPSTAGGLFGTAPLTFPAALVQDWQLGTGGSRGAETTAAARYSPGGRVMNLVEVGRLRVSPDSHDTAAMALAFSLCRFPDRTAPSPRTTADRRLTPVVIGGVKGTRVDLNVNIPDGPGGPETDWFTVIVVGTTPTSYFLGGSNKGNAEARGQVDTVLRALRTR